MDARRLSSLQNAPQVLYSNRDPPLELRGVAGLKNSEDIGYVTFSERPELFLCRISLPLISNIHLLITSSLPSTLPETRSRLLNYIPHSTIPGLFTLPYQMLKSIHALTHAVPRFRVSEGAKPREN